MPRRQKILLSWSGGKDSALSLFELLSPKYEIVGLLTTFVGPEKRVQMHGIRKELIEAQASSLELPLICLDFEKAPSNEDYEGKLGDLLQRQRTQGLEGVAFGDLHLEDIKKYRQKFLKKLGLKAIFPIWQWSPDQVQAAFFSLKFKAVVHCVKDKLGADFVGRDYDQALISDLPENVDPCGEKGEFHSFVFDGLPFQKQLKIEKGDIFKEGRFLYQDLKLAS
jgi:uncharacterized protein (TIGR00290 family)